MLSCFVAGNRGLLLEFVNPGRALSWGPRGPVSVSYRRLATALVAAVLAVTASVAYGQRIWVGGGRFYRTAPKWATPANFDGTFNFCRAFYTSDRREDGGSGWDTDFPGADNNFSVRLAELTFVRVRLDHAGQPDYVVLRLTDPLLARCPFLHFEDAGTARFTDEEVASLRAYGRVYMSAYAADVVSPWQTCAAGHTDRGGRINCHDAGQLHQQRPARLLRGGHHHGHHTEGQHASDQHAQRLRGRLHRRLHQPRRRPDNGSTPSGRIPTTSRLSVWFYGSVHAHADQPGRRGNSERELLVTDSPPPGEGPGVGNPGRTRSLLDDFVTTTRRPSGYAATYCAIRRKGVGCARQRVEGGNMLSKTSLAAIAAIAVAALVAGERPGLVGTTTLRTPLSEPGS